MTIKAADNILPLPLDNNKTNAAESNEHKEFVFNKVLFDTDALSALQSIFNSSDSVGSKSASVKFMITLQDETGLQNLGYSKEQIDQMKPQEAENILKAGIKAEHFYDVI
jgi:hypothetical protein